MKAATSAPPTNSGEPSRLQRIRRRRRMVQHSRRRGQGSVAIHVTIGKVRDGGKVWGLGTTEGLLPVVLTSKMASDKGIPRLYQMRILLGICLLGLLLPAPGA